MAPRPRSRASLEQELKDVQRRIAEAEQREAGRLGKLAIQAGLARLELDEAIVIEEFGKIAARFQGEADAAGGEGAARTRSVKRSGLDRPLSSERNADQPALAVRDDPGQDR